MANEKKAPRKSRVYSISLPPELADLAEFLAQKENRTISELFRETLRQYQKQRVRAIFDEIGEYVKTLPPTPYTEEDVPRLVKEVRAEMRAEREARARKAG